MIKVFTFIWEALVGLVNIMEALVSGLPVAAQVMLMFGPLGALLVGLIAVRVVKWVINR